MLDVKNYNKGIRTLSGVTRLNLNQKRIILIFRWLLILVLIALMFSREERVAPPSWSYLLGFLFVVTNLVLSFVPPRFFGELILTGPMVVVDIAFVTAAIYISGNLTGDLYLLYFLTIFLAAISRDVRISLLASVVVILFYGGLSSWQVGSNQFLTTNFLIRIPFFLLMAVFSGFMASQARLREKEAEEVTLSNVYLRKDLDRALETEEETREELWALYQHNENILESLNTGVLVVGAQQIVTTFNAEATRITGLSKDSVVGKPLSKVPGLAAFSLVLTDVADAGKVRARDEVVVTTPDGRSVPIGLSTAVLRDPQKKPCGAIAIFKDLAELKDLERRVKRSEHLALLGEMAASVAHEIRNPLNSISGFAQLIGERTEENDKRKLFAQIVLEESQRIEKIIGNTLLFSRDAPRTSTPADINEVIASCVTASSDKAETASVKIALDLDPDLPPVKGDAGRLEQVFNNLILNAIQAMPEGGDVSIVTRTHDDTVKATVKDTGAGIPPGMADAIFLPFFTTKQGGTGLGLSVCRKIVEDHNGYLEVESKPGQGAEFKMTLPVFCDAYGTETKQGSKKSVVAKC
jgi:PAS domain S-box-containing protein